MKARFVLLIACAADVLAGAESFARFDPRSGLQTLEIPADWPAEVQSVHRATLMSASLGLDQTAIEDLVLQCRP